LTEQVPVRALVPKWERVPVLAQWLWWPVQAPARKQVPEQAPWWEQAPVRRCW